MSRDAPSLHAGAPGMLCGIIVTFAV